MFPNFFLIIDYVKNGEVFEICKTQIEFLIGDGKTIGNIFIIVKLIIYKYMDKILKVMN